MWDVEVRHNLPSKGRGLFATRGFSQGEVVFEEEPVVSSQFLWNSLYKYRACDHCMKCLETAEEMSQRLTANADLVLPHTECCQINQEQHVSCPHCQLGYCSSECRDAAWQRYHKVLCLGPSQEDPDHPFNKLADVWRNIHYPPEMSSIMLLARMVATVKQASDKSAVVSVFNNFCRATVNEEAEIAHKLLGKEFQSQLELLRAQFTEAMYTEDLQQAILLTCWFTVEGFQSIFALIGTNGQGIGTSSISIWVQKCEALDLPQTEKDELNVFIDQLYEDMDKVSGQFLNCEGSGLYILQSSCNHSCVPNCEVTFPFNNSRLAVRAVQSIKTGEEIFISYLDECQLERSRHSRRKLLQENYLFKCSCSKCDAEADDPDVTSEEDMDDDEDGLVEDSFS